MERIVLEHEALNEGHLRYEHLLNRPFIHGELDCLTMLQDMFMDNLNIKISNYARPEDWWLTDLNFYMDYYAAEGFLLLDDVKLSELRPMDVFLIAIPDPRNPNIHVANHCAIYLGQGQIIHHRMGCNSQRKEYRYTLKDYTVAVIRHRDCPNLMNNKESSVDIMEHILPHKRAMLQGALDGSKD